MKSGQQPPEGDGEGIGAARGERRRRRRKREIRAREMGDGECEPKAKQSRRSFTRPPMRPRRKGGGTDEKLIPGIYPSWSRGQDGERHTRAVSGYSVAGLYPMG